MSASAAYLFPSDYLRSSGKGILPVLCRLRFILRHLVFSLSIFHFYVDMTVRIFVGKQYYRLDMSGDNSIDVMRCPELFTICLETTL